MIGRDPYSCKVQSHPSLQVLFPSPGSDLYLLIYCKVVPMTPPGVQHFARIASRTQRNNLLSKLSPVRFLKDRRMQLGEQPDGNGQNTASRKVLPRP